jgi:hypothetical protein
MLEFAPWEEMNAYFLLLMDIELRSEKQVDILLTIDEQHLRHNKSGIRFHVSFFPFLQCQVESWSS